MPMDRRTFIALGGALPLATPARAAPRDGSSGSRAATGLVVNALGGLADPNRPPPPDADVAPPVLSPRAVADALASGVHAINLTLGYVFGEGDPFELSVRSIAQWDALVRRNEDRLLCVLATKDIAAARDTRRIGLIYGFQNGAMLGTDPGRVETFAGLGVRVLQLTYNGPNGLGGGCLAPGDPALSPFGHAAVERLNEFRIVVDLSHSGTRTCLDAVRASRQPVAITHTGCRAITDLPRNKTDEELRAVAERGGFVGIYFMPFLTTGRNATAEDVVRHLEHALDVCGEDHVGLGTDGSFTPIDDMEAYRRALADELAERARQGISAPGESTAIVPFAIDLTGPGQFRDLARRLAARGHPARRIEKILGDNFVRFARDVWGA
jgi:membrane dipeptidase